MITPTKYLKLDTCALNVAAHTIQLLLLNGPMKFDELRDRLEYELGEGARYEFPQAVGLLYLLERLEYSDESDAFQIKTSYHR
jgi:hypothetical protein